ncbi:MAG: sugar phosphate nucleotidyltransferase [Deltaproteobacteria bacterium]|nr:sugar phosphate nucleotidyltransferase [Deltaproteobacteria bacterium]
MKLSSSQSLSNQTDVSPFTVVLAGGEGLRLQGLTRALYGHPVPKQFAELTGGGSLLQQTVERALCQSDADRIMVVASHKYRETARLQLQRYPGVQLICQPFAAGTALGIGTALRPVMARDPNATVCFMPSDHHFSEPEVFGQQLRALTQAPHKDAITLVGVKADRAESELGWIVPGKALGTVMNRSLFEIEAFHEKPNENVTRTLMGRGALLHTFIMVGKANAFWRALDACLPDHAEALAFASRASDPWARAAVVRAYKTLPPASFSVDVLQKWPSVQVFEPDSCGWADWGTPERVFASLKGKPDFLRLQERLAFGARTVLPALLLSG